VDNAAGIEMETETVLFTQTNPDTGVRASVFAFAKGGHGVEIFDTDAEQALPSLRVFPNQGDAEIFAARCCA
jgi:hypothetical protein